MLCIYIRMLITYAVVCYTYASFSGVGFLPADGGSITRMVILANDMDFLLKALEGYNLRGQLSV
jgi:hypothetical protein